ncbi:MAG: hypothetical protein IJS03_04910 [Eubacterium sp.]|nr:hypothetical protein [Eubacterium sp.]
MSTKNNAISLRSIYILIVVGAVLLAGLMLYSTAYLSSSYRALTENTIALRKASLELMDVEGFNDWDIDVTTTSCRSMWKSISRLKSTPSTP